MAALRHAAAAVRALGVFSRNERAEDVATGDLKYLLVPFLLAEVRPRALPSAPASPRAHTSLCSCWFSCASRSARRWCQARV